MNKEAKVSTLRHYLPSGAKPFDFNFQKIGAVKFDSFDGSTESSFLDTNEGFLDVSAEVLVKKIILHLGTQSGKKLNDTEIELIAASELEAFSKVLLENNRHLWNDYQPSGDTQTGEKPKPFKAVPIERVDGESNTHYLKRMFDDYNKVNLESIRNAQDKFKSILKKDSEGFKAIQENVINSMRLNAQISINEKEKWLHQDYGLLSRTPSPSDKTNDIINDLTGTMQKMHQLSLSQAKMISSLNEIGIQVSAQTASNIKSATRFNTTTIVIAILSMLVSTGISISTCHDSKMDGDRNSKTQKATLDQAINQNENCLKNLKALEKIDSSMQKISLELKGIKPPRNLKK